MNTSTDRSNANAPSQNKSLGMRAKLEKEARGRGGYRWNEQDLFNAFQWFVTSTRSNITKASSSSSLACNPSSHAEKYNITSFLESLLRNPGIMFYRTLIGRKRKRNSTLNTTSNNCAAFGTSSDVVMEGPLLPFILAYCLSHCIIEAEEPADDKIPHKSSTQHGISMDWLESILTDVAMERRLTEILYNKYSRLLQSSATNTAKFHGSLSHSSSSSSDQVASVLEQMIDYFSQPSIIVQSVYASKLYTCYLRLLDNDGNHDSLHGVQEEGTAVGKVYINTEKAITFLKKLQSLAEFHQDVAQVLFLIAFEPIKRVGMYLDDWGWIRHTISTSKDEVLNHTIGREPELEMVFHPISEAIINTIQNCEVYNISPCLVCMLAKIHSPFAKEFLYELIRCYVEHQRQVPIFIANEAIKCSSLSEEKETAVDDPGLIVEKCRSIFQLWKNTCQRMKTLLIGAIENERASSIDQMDNIALLALDEIERIIG
jgi:hypothetical protein